MMSITKPGRALLITVVIVGLLASAAYLPGAKIMIRFSPQNTASRISGLPAAKGRIVEFSEQDSRTHADRVVFGQLQFSPDEFAALVRSAEEQGYVWLTPDDENALTVRDAASEPRTALYRLRGSVEDGSFDLVILVPERRQMVIRTAGR